MMFLFASIALSDDYRADLPVDHASQPWIVALAADLRNDAGDSVEHFHHRIRADGRRIMPGAEAVHGITSREAASIGITELVALGALLGMADQASYVVGHGLRARVTGKAVATVLRRRGKKTEMWTRPGLETIDTMEAATPFCRLAGADDSGAYRAPSLDEACSALLGMTPRAGPVSAWDDIPRIAALFDFLVKAKAVEIAE